MNTEEKKVTEQEKEEVIVEEINDEETLIVDGDDDDDFIQTLENLDKEDEEEEKRKKEGEEEALRIKNKNAEEARKRREAEEKARLEEEEAKRLEEEGNEEKEEKPESTQGVAKDAKEQVKDLAAKYPDLDLKELDTNQDFQAFLDGKWHQGGKSITEIYEDFIGFQSRVTKKTKEEVENSYKRNPTPGIKGSGGGTGGATKVEDVFSIEEIQAITEKLPTMNPRQYDEIEKKLERSIAHHRNNNK